MTSRYVTWTSPLLWAVLRPSSRPVVWSLTRLVSQLSPCYSRSLPLPLFSLIPLFHSEVHRRWISTCLQQMVFTVLADVTRFALWIVLVFHGFQRFVYVIRNAGVYLQGDDVCPSILDFDWVFWRLKLNYFFWVKWRLREHWRLCIVDCIVKGKFHPVTCPEGTAGGGEV